MAPRSSRRRLMERQRALSTNNAMRSVRVPPTESRQLPSEQPDDQQSADSTWLDSLPPHVCARIAAHITHARDSKCPELLNENALALAETSSRQRIAMAESLDHTPDLRYGDIRLWLEIFENPVSIDAREGRGNAVLHLLACPSLRMAHISNRGNHLSAIARGNAVLDLFIHVERLTETRYTTMLESLQKLSHLVSLSIVCKPPRACAFAGIIDGQHAYNRLAEACPRLTALHMCCQCRAKIDHSPVSKAFPSLTELTVAKPLPDASLQYMRSRESVILQSGARSLCCYASEIGSAVTAIKFPYPKWSYVDPGDAHRKMDCVKEEEVALLKDCPRLREVDLVLYPGAERGLPYGRLLLSLQLYWSIKVRGYAESSWLGRPLAGSFLRRLCGHPLLHRLALVGAPVKMDDLVTVLQIIGKSLEELTLSVTEQPDVATDRLLGIMGAVTKYNKNLHTLRIVEPQWLDWGELTTCVSGLSKEERKNFLPRFRVLVRRLQRNNAWFDTGILLQTADHIVIQCENDTDK